MANSETKRNPESRIFVKVFVYLFTTARTLAARHFFRSPRVYRQNYDRDRKIREDFPCDRQYRSAKLSNCEQENSDFSEYCIVYLRPLSMH